MWILVWIFLPFQKAIAALTHMDCIKKYNSALSLSRPPVRPQQGRNLIWKCWLINRKTDLRAPGRETQFGVEDTETRVKGSNACQWCPGHSGGWSEKFNWIASLLASFISNSPCPILSHNSSVQKVTVTWFIFPNNQNISNPHVQYNHLYIVLMSHYLGWESVSLSLNRKQITHVNEVTLSNFINKWSLDLQMWGLGPER